MRNNDTESSVNLKRHPKQNSRGGLVEKCPKCGEWALVLDTRLGVLECRHTGCNYIEKIDVERYLEKTNMLPKLVGALKINGNLKPIQTH
jgi:hypothetical protein